MQRKSINVENVPEELKAVNQWVVWRLEPGKKDKPTKVPYNPRTGQKASSNGPETWASFERALDAFNRSQRYSGIGFVFTKEDDFVGVDLDHCRDPETGEMQPDALRVITMLDSHTELSPSGTGIHIILRAKLPPGRRKVGPYEAYEHGRSFTFTSQHIEGTSVSVNARQEQVDEFCAEFLADKQPRQQTFNNVLRLDDAAVLDKARAARNGADFSRLYDGYWQGKYASQSEADLALCNELAFWSGGDAQLMDSLFRSSGMMRDKWDQRRGGRT